MTHSLPISWLSAFMVVVCLLVFGVRTEAAPRASTFLLSNGIQVVVIPDHRVPVVAHMVWYRAGAADDPFGTSGIAHFLEHLMFKSTTKLKSGQFSKVLNGLGGRGNAQTNYDTTVYFQRVPKEHLRAVMTLEADRMVNLKFVEDEVRTERDVILEERRSTVDVNPVRVLGEQMLAALYVNHPYGRPALGWADEMAALTREDALTFYKRFYSPSNAVLVVAGDTTPGEVRTLAQETYGSTKRAAAPVTRRRPKEPEPVASRHVAIERAGSPIFLRYYHVPSYASAKPGEAESLDLLAQILGGDDTSRLYRLLEERKLASNAGSDYVGNMLDSGRMVFVIQPFAGVSFAMVEAALDEAIADVRDAGVTTEDLDLAKLALRARSVFETDDLITLARRYGEAVALGRTPADVDDLPRRIQQRTTEDIQRAAREFLSPIRAVTGTVSAPTEDRAGAAQPPTRSR